MVSASVLAIAVSELWSRNGWPARSTVGLGTLLLVMMTVRIWPNIRAGDRRFVAAMYVGVAVMTGLGHLAFTLLH